jgi:uncharacterized membrane protein YgdD (TMEM256/DUF423 family)
MGKRYYASNSSKIAKILYNPCLTPKDGKMNTRLVIMIASVNMLLAIGAGAFGAHGLKRVLDPDMLAVWHTAVTYQVIHALGLFIIAVLAFKLTSPLLIWSTYLMLGGIVLFSGSLYILALTGVRILGMFTPIGGVLFLLSWLLILIAAMRAEDL